MVLPLSEFDLDPGGRISREKHAVVQRRNKRTLAMESQFTVDDHVGCIAVTPEFLIGGNWDSRDFYFWDHQGKLIRKVPSTSANSYQDLKFRERSSWLHRDSLRVVMPPSIG